MNPVKDFDEFVQVFNSPETPTIQSWRPVIFCLKPEEKKSFSQFCKVRHIDIVDTIDQQLTDLAKIEFPSVQEAEKQSYFISNLLKEHGGRTSYGNWIYLPWLRKVVHVLDEDAYFHVITNRNQLKITLDEQQALRTKRIGIIGLSVGAEAAITVAQEHLCGEIVIADFDKLDLSNLNRLNARFDEIGLSKTLITARRIIGINPYMNVKIFEKGVNDANVDKFLEGLDLLIEECDDLVMKFKIRQIAKRRGLNIVFAADERGMLSIEPYRYCKDLPVFHGRVTKAQAPKDTFSNPKDFMKELTKWLGGWDQISERSRASVESIGESLCGYPQLAGEARLAAGQVGHAARRLLLSEKLPPFLDHFDLDKFLPADS